MEEKLLKEKLKREDIKHIVKLIKNLFDDLLKRIPFALAVEWDYDNNPCNEDGGGFSVLINETGNQIKMVIYRQILTDYVNGKFENPEYIQNLKWMLAHELGHVIIAPLISAIRLDLKQRTESICDRLAFILLNKK